MVLKENFCALGMQITHSLFGNMALKTFMYFCITLIIWGKPIKFNMIVESMILSHFWTSWLQRGSLLGHYGIERQPPTHTICYLHCRYNCFVWKGVIQSLVYRANTLCQSKQERAKKDLVSTAYPVCLVESITHMKPGSSQVQRGNEKPLCIYLFHMLEVFLKSSEELVDITSLGNTSPLCFSQYVFI